MSALWRLARQSAWSRRGTLGLVVASIALSTLLLLGIERLRHQVRENFAQAISGTDLIVGARTGPVQLLLYAVFHLGSATNNMRWDSAQALAGMRGVAWTVPIALGDSFRGFAVVGTTGGFFEHYRFGAQQPLRWSQGRVFASGRDGVYEAVLGAEVARRLDLAPGAQVVLSHGDGALRENDHADKPFTVVGVLAPTGTPVDRAVHVPLEGIEALHVDWTGGARWPGQSVSAEQALGQDLTPRTVTAVLVGLTSRGRVFGVQRAISAFAEEPLMAVMPGVALDELWTVVGAGEQALQAMSVLVAIVSLAGLVAVVLAGLGERRRELAVLRAVGAAPGQIFVLLGLEGFLVTFAGVTLGAGLLGLGLWALGPWLLDAGGLVLPWTWPRTGEWLWMAAVLAAGSLASLVPAWRAYRQALADGLSPQV